MKIGVETDRLMRWYRETHEYREDRLMKLVLETG
jgi:hypothetical protein